MNILSAGILSLIVAIPLSSQAEGWRGIMPLHSTRADVERLIGPPSKQGGSLYETDNEKVFVLYSGGSCREDSQALWNVARDTVIDVAMYPKLRRPLSELRLEPGKYRRVPDPHLNEIVQYVNDDEGIQIEVSAVPGRPETITSVTHGPSVKDNDLRCRVANEQVVGGHVRKFDEYSNISFVDEKARLDNFAIYLQKDVPEFKGYIIVYAGPRARTGEAEARAKRAKDYLVKVRGIEAARIVTIDGGCREKLEVELYAVPSSMSPPTPNPYRNE